jgi:hypothetical protein
MQIPLPQLIADTITFIKNHAADLQVTADAVKNAAEIGGGAVTLLSKGRRMVAYLINTVKPSKPAAAGNAKTASRKRRDVAILVEVARPMGNDVAQYLAGRKIKADIVLITTDAKQTGQLAPLDVNDQKAWSALATEFRMHINRVKSEIGGAKVHLFFSAPLPVVFAAGCIWGTVDEATVYHWDKGTYHPVIQISRALNKPN